jgi:hypothetical protein
MQKEKWGIKLFSLERVCCYILTLTNKEKDNKGFLERAKNFYFL